MLKTEHCTFFVISLASYKRKAYLCSVVIFKLIKL